MKTIIPFLRQFGISPEQLGPERISKLQKFAAKISDPSSITPELSAELMGTLGISLGKPRETKNKSQRKIRRNDPCPCKSGLKWKKCCLLKLTP